jgi:hypothetical protein
MSKRSKSLVVAKLHAEAPAVILFGESGQYLWKRWSSGEDEPRASSYACIHSIASSSVGNILPVTLA